jgi:hypothetical protein
MPARIQKESKLMFVERKTDKSNVNRCFLLWCPRLHIRLPRAVGAGKGAKKVRKNSLIGYFFSPSEY